MDGEITFKGLIETIDKVHEYFSAQAGKAVNLSLTLRNWFRENMMAEGDNPPVEKDHTLVEYALAGMDNSLFVSRCQLQLPRNEEIQRFLEEKMREIGR